MTDPGSEVGRRVRAESGSSADEADPFWDRPDIVDRFTDRDPDHRLQGMLEDVDDPTAFRVLDLGCAAGRNTLYLAAMGVDVQALDPSEAMLARTRERLGAVLDASEAERRVRFGVMTDLGAYDADAFDLVIALGVLHTAVSVEEWNRALSEIARVLRTDGRVLVSSFSPDSRPEGEPLPRVEGSPHAYRWRDGRPMVLMDGAEHDASFGSHGFTPAEETETVHVPLEDGFRVAVNAIYEWSG